MRKARSLILLVPIIMMCTACSSGTDPVKKEFQWYVDAMSSAFDLEGEAVRGYAAVSGKNYKNDAEVNAALKKIVIPKFTEFRKEIYEIKPVTNELSGFHRIYRQKADAHLKGFTLLSEAVDKGDKAMVDEAIKSFNLSGMYFKKWEENLKAFKEKYGDGEK